MRKFAVRSTLLLTLLLISIALLPIEVRAQARERSEVPVAQTWNLDDVYPSDEAWTEAKDRIAPRFDKIVTFKGKLAESPDQLLACLTLDSDMSKELVRLFCYASMKSDQDSRVPKYQGMKQSMRQLLTDYSAKSSFIGPEVAAMDQATIDEYIEKEPGLKIYRMYLSDIQRTKAHRLSVPEEKILAESGLMASTPGTINGIFSNAELPYPEITLSDGVKAKLDVAGYCRFRTLANRSDRKAVFAAFFGELNKFQETFGAQLAGEVNKDMFYAKARKYDSSLQYSLDDNNIPVEVYHTLIENVHKNLPTLHRYLRLKQRMLGVEQLEYSDVYAPTVAKVDLKFPYEKAQEVVLEAVKPLGTEYVDTIRRAYRERWIDVYPSPGKTSGAYSNDSCYDVHPYVMLNYNGQYEDVSTLAHELGHTMHGYYANKTQPYPTADYPIFLAEVASTLNEALLTHRMLETTKDDDARLSLLMSYLDGIRQTVFRQTQFAEFELAIHEKAEGGEPLTGEAISKIYGDIARKYYGHDQGVCTFDSQYDIEWAFVHHFFYDYYVYQYSTSFTASTAMSQRILAGEPGAVEQTIAFLSSGGSKYPIETLKDAGVDMLGSEPFERTMKVMNQVMDDMEKILDKKEKK
ncbi:MAG TPA: oligoendopeptidase F [Thermoguttaceae bacterium]|nr:oligoendopeptidase F [Thermoguttaceae bacterium]